MLDQRINFDMVDKLVILAAILVVNFNCLAHSLPTHHQQAKNKPSESPKGNKVILILADGVRFDYVNDPNLKGFHRMANKGVRAEYVTPIFPANSYPNWYTIVTGKSVSEFEIFQTELL